MTQTVYIKSVAGINSVAHFKKLENVYVFTPQEYKEQIDAAILLGKTLEMDFNKQEHIEQMIGDAFDAGRSCIDGWQYKFDKEQYLNNLK